MRIMRMHRLSWLDRKAREHWTTLCLAVRKFAEIDGEQRAGAFAYYAFLSLFPLMILLVVIASIFIDPDKAFRGIVDYIENYIPINSEMRHYIFKAIADVIKSRTQASASALLLLGLGTLQFFKALIRATNRAWNVEIYNWWRLPLKSLVLLGVMVFAIFAGIVSPLLLKIVQSRLFSADDFLFWKYFLASFLMPMSILFFSIGLFYKLAPNRPTRWSEVWVAALYATLLLRIGETFFVIYLKNFASLNAVYGTFGGIIALLLWIYLSGCIFILGVCFCASQKATT